MLSRVENRAEWGFAFARLWLAHPALTEVPEPEQMRQMIDQIGEEDEGG
jgi:hypothetical protein